MQNTNEDLIRKLLETSAEFKKAHNTHREYEKKIGQMERKKLLTTEESAERLRLKKLKLALKDKMEEMLSKHRA
ncbi:MAG: DUF465 domain-containing protein [Deltaproteobacteria bacterium]|nr:DUF465 domain-containing protein [Deltaproteobacteria bacterium]